MPQATTSHQKILNLCLKYNWTTYPNYEDNFDYDSLFNIIKYSKVKIEIGKTHNPKTWDEYNKLLLTYLNYKDGVTLEKMIFTYGDEFGLKKFNDYKEKQAYSNTFEYKNKKHGYTRTQFDEYNKSRAVTLDNLIKKHGLIEGKNKYERYCKTQAYTNTLEYLGPERYSKVSKLKSHSLPTYIERYGEELGKTKLIEFYRKISSKTNSTSISDISQEIFWSIESMLTQREKESTYFASKNYEYVVLHENTCFLYDFICEDLKLCIEYNGDHYHGNPLLYKPDDYLRGRGCTKIKTKDKWKSDKKKIDWLKSQNKFDTIIIWESDWMNSKDLVLHKVLNFIESRRKNLLEVNKR